MAAGDQQSEWGDSVTQAIELKTGVLDNYNGLTLPMSVDILEAK